jgi:hypothetical protein
MPESMMNTRKASMNLRRFGVFSRYDFHKDSIAPDGAALVDLDGGIGWGMSWRLLANNNKQKKIAV